MKTAENIARRRKQLDRVTAEIEALRGNLPDDSETLVSEASTRAALKETAAALRAEIDRLQAEHEAEQEMIRRGQARADFVDAIERGTAAMHRLEEVFEAAAHALMPHLTEARKAFLEWRKTGPEALQAAKRYYPGVGEGRHLTEAQREEARAWLKELEAEGHNWRVPLRHVERYVGPTITRYPNPEPPIGEPLQAALWGLVDRLETLREPYEAAVEAEIEGLDDADGITLDDPTNGQPVTA